MVQNREGKPVIKTFPRALVLGSLQEAPWVLQVRVRWEHSQRKGAAVSGAGGGHGLWVTLGSIARYQVEYKVPQRPQGTGSRTATVTTCKLIHTLCLSISSSRHEGNICLGARKRFALSCVWKH